MRLHRRLMGLIVANEQQTAVDFWMQGFDAAIEHSGKPVCSLTSFTASPASRNVLAVPPVKDLNSGFGQNLCERTRPVLSETEISAR